MMSLFNNIRVEKIKRMTFKILIILSIICTSFGQVSAQENTDSNENDI